jgi:hypothetical protein
MTEQEDGIRLKDLLDIYSKEEYKEIIEILNRDQKRYHQEQLILSGVVGQSEQLCDNPHCEDGIVDRDMYGHPIYCQVCDKHN